MSNQGTCTPTGIIQITPLTTTCCDFFGQDCKGSLRVFGFGTCVTGTILHPCTVALCIKLSKFNDVTHTYEPYAGGSNTPFDIHGEWSSSKAVDCGAGYSIELFIDCFMTNISNGVFKIDAALYASGTCEVGDPIAAVSATFPFLLP